jgi:hypothetical protein
VNETVRVFTGDGAVQEFGEAVEVFGGAGLTGGHEGWLLALMVEIKVGRQEPFSRARDVEMEESRVVENDAVTGVEKLPEPRKGGSTSPMTPMNWLRTGRPNPNTANIWPSVVKVVMPFVVWTMPRLTNNS